MVSSLDVPSGTTILPNKALFRISPDARRAARIRIGADSAVAELQVHLPHGLQLDRALVIGARVIAGRISLSSNDQQRNRRRPTDGMVRVSGDDVLIGSLNVRNVDAAVILFNGPDMVERVTIEDLDIRSYSRGLFVRHASAIRVNRAKIVGRSPTSNQKPGNNGILVSATTDLIIRNVEVADAGEHGIRVGGSYGGEPESRRLAFYNVAVYRSGRSGVKLNPKPGQKIKHVKLENISVFDSAWQNRPGPNEEGLRIERAEDITVRGLRVLRERQPRSAFAGVFVRNSMTVRIFDVSIASPSVAGIIISVEKIQEASVEMKKISVDRLTVTGAPKVISVSSSSSEEIDVRVCNNIIRNAKDVAPLNLGVGAPFSC
jgi:hypothetical protein